MERHRDVGSILNQEDPLEEGMATHSSVLAWRISLTEEPGGLMRSQRVGHDCSHVALSTRCTVGSGHQHSGLCAPAQEGGFRFVSCRVDYWC